MRVTLDQILSLGGCEVACGPIDGVSVEGAGVDSRHVVPGELFVGVRGEHDDGGRHAPDALRAGAAAAVVGEDAWAQIAAEAEALGRPVLVAADPVALLGAAGRLALARLGARVVGVTGSYGKTTTKDIVVAMLRAAGARAEGTPGNRNTEIGVPLALLGLPEGTEVAVVEMGMRGTGQIAELAALAPPDVACITSVGPVHLELLGTVEAVAAAKAEILGALRPGGAAVVPAGDALLAPHLATLDPGVRLYEFGDRPDLDLDLSLRKGWELRNAAAALACCRALGRAPAPGARVEVALSAMRGQERPLPGDGVLIEDCYNANPPSMRAALADLAGRGGRRVAVLADMMELGPDETAFHREVGAEAARLGIDLLVAVGRRARGYAEGAGGVDALYFPTVDEAVAGVPGHIRPGDAVLVKGSRSMAMERVAAAILDDGAGCPGS